MGTNGNARNFRPFEDDYEQEEYQQPRVAQRPRANVPQGSFVPPQYIRPGVPMRTMGTPPATRRTEIPQPLPGQYLAPRQPTGALRAPTLRPQSQSRPGPLSNLSLNAGTLKMALIAAGAIVAMVAVYFLVSTALHWWQNWQDDVTYGRPRTVQVDQFVGHNELEGTPSHFIAQNNNRQITVIEYPGGDVTKTRVIPGPRLFGKDMELAPVKINFRDINGDNNVDMVLTVDNQDIIYINENANFRPISGEERSRLSKLGGGSK